jgi:hypothetical protein
MAVTDIMRLAGEKWRNLSKDEKLKYEEKCEIDKERYMRCSK